MQVRDEFYPDIETKYEHLLTHMLDKNKVTDDLIKILKEICNLELFYSSSLDKFANAVSKLLIGKDPIKDILIIFERIISSKSEESEKLAHEIKDDLIPYLLASMDLPAQQKLRDRQASIKETRNNMQNKLRNLYSQENRFKKSLQEIKRIPKTVSYNEQQNLLEQYRKQEDLFSDTIDSYNASIDDYMLKYSDICEELSDIETRRKMNFRDAVNKVVIFEINYLKNIEYNLTRYAESLGKMEGRLIIQDRVLGGNSQEFYDTRETGGVVQLAKISNKNYIDNIRGRKNLEPQLIWQQQKIYELRSVHQSGKIKQHEFQELAEEISTILDYIEKTNHHNLLINVVALGKDLYYQHDQNLKVTLLNAFLCHQLFAKPAFWAAYRKRLFGKIEREDSMKNTVEVDRQKRLESLLERDLNFLKNIEINPIISQILRELTVIITPKGSQNDISTRAGSTIECQSQVHCRESRGSERAKKLFT